MPIDFEDWRLEPPTIGSAMSWRERWLLSLFFHLLIGALIVILPELPIVRSAAEARARRLAELVELQRQQQRDQAAEDQRFVFVQPRVDVEALEPPDTNDLSDLDREAQAPERAETPTNSLPFARGDSFERVDGGADALEPVDEPDPGSGELAELDSVEGTDAAESEELVADAEGSLTVPSPLLDPDGPGDPAPQGSLREALRNLQRYIDQESFDNPGGGVADYGPWIYFDTKGVDFGPWIRRFVAQIRRNWLPLIPNAAMTMRGHVVITFYVHRDGSLTDLMVPGPSSVEGFNHAAYNALLWSNPTQPLPEEYPSDRAFFTVTFFYNERPPAQ